MELLTPVGMYIGLLLGSILIFFLCTRFLKRYIADWVPRNALSLLITIVLAMIFLLIWSHFMIEYYREQIRY